MNEDQVNQVLFPSTVKVSLPSVGKTASVKKLSMRTSGPVTALVNKVMDDALSAPEKLQGLLGGTMDAGGTAISISLTQLSGVSFLMKLFAEYATDVAEVAASLTDGLTKDDILDADLDEALLAIKAVVDVNRGFFVGKVLPVLGTLVVGAQGEASN